MYKNKITIIINSFPSIGLVFSLLIIIISSCGTSQFLENEQTLLKRNNITYINGSKIEEKVLLNTELRTFIKQKPNSKFFLLFPREYYYMANDQAGDTSWWNNWLRNEWGEIPSIYDQILTQESAVSMQKYLRNNKGYYDAEVLYETNTSNTSTKINYIVDTKDRYYVNSLEYLSYDPNILAEINAIKDQSFLSEGTPIDILTFNKEKQRITNHLQNIGYAEFESNLFKIYGDSTDHKLGIDIFMEVIPKQDGKNYIKFNVGTINVYTDFYQNQDLTKLETLKSKGINYYFQSKEPIIHISRLENFIYFNTDSPFRERDRFNTFAKLSQLDMYKFCDVTPVLNPEVDSILDFNIFLTPQKYKWLTDTGLEAFYSTINNSRQRFGTSAFTTIINRNIFGGAEKNKLDLELGVELKVTPEFGAASSNASIQDVLEIPRHIDILKSTKLMSILNIFPDKLYNDIVKESRTIINIGFNFQNIDEFYSSRSFNTSLGYTYRLAKNHFFSVRQFSLNLNDNDLSTEFLDRIENNQLIINSLSNNLSTGFLFRDFNYVYNGSKSIHGNSFAFLGGFELSGWEVAIANKLYNSISKSDDTFKLFDQFDFSKYVKLELDGRHYKDFSKSHSLASRINLGIAIPFSDSDIIPYTKQFYAGGPNSMRAWQIRELGPGGFEFEFPSQDSSQLFFQQGDIKLEFNTEYRFDLFYIFEMALFLDAGNVWNINEDVDRPGAKFGSQFYKQIAIGGGWGLRFDFIYFNIRFDFGYKIRNPFPDENGNYWLPRKSYRGFGNFNIAVNYPF